jgi:hypothetical protein
MTGDCQGTGERISGATYPITDDAEEQRHRADWRDVGAAVPTEGAGGELPRRVYSNGRRAEGELAREDRPATGERFLERTAEEHKGGPRTVRRQERTSYR